MSLSTATVLDEHGRVEHLVTQVEDVTAQHTLAEQLRHAAMHDPLTGLPNRTLFLQRLTHGADRPQAGAPLSVLFCHVDYFNAINNTHGHASGDTVLVALADRLRDVLRPGDTAARLGGDEFAVICENTDADTAHTLADQLGTTLAAPLVVGQGTPDRATVNRHRVDRYRHLQRPVTGPGRAAPRRRHRHVPRQKPARSPPLTTTTTTTAAAQHQRTPNRPQGRPTPTQRCARCTV